jgi:hypothetical protein
MDRSLGRVHDYLILGAGPAGLQLGYFLGRTGRDYVILEAGDGPGTFFRTFPRHRRLLSLNDSRSRDAETDLRWDWNSLLTDRADLRFRRYSQDRFPPADDFQRYLGDFAQAHGLAVRPRTGVRRISRRGPGGPFRAETADGSTVSGRRLIVATGLSLPYLPPVPGIELAEPYTSMPVEPAAFRGQEVLILGGGQSALETARGLAGSAGLLHVACPGIGGAPWQATLSGPLRDFYGGAAESALPGELLDARVERIERRGRRLAVTLLSSPGLGRGERRERLYDRVLACTGFRFDAGIFDPDCRPALVIDDRFPEQTSAWESVNVPDLYFAGTLMQVRDYRRTTSGFLYGYRYNIRALHRILENRYQATSWPCRLLPEAPEILADEVLERLCRTSALWQQFGFLCDVAVLPQAGSLIRYYEEVPVGYVRDSDLLRHRDYFTVTLEFGREDADPFGAGEMARAAGSVLHPVLRRFRGPRLLSEHHLPESATGEWRDEQAHAAPLRRYLEREYGVPALSRAS